MEIFDEVRFGVELETCIHILGQTYFVESDMDEKTFFNIVMDCAKTKLPQLKWGTQNYDSWNVEHDGSIDCDRKKKYCMVKGIYTENCSGLYFRSMEFVSPVLKGREGLKDFALFWFGFFMSNNMVHLVSQTQGLHVNLSHPNLDPMDFAKLWVYYEPVIWQLLPERRREDAKHYAEKVKSMKRDFSIKYGAIHIHGYGDTRRIEVRVQEGLFIFSEILTWILLLMHMVVQAILDKDRVYDRFADQITVLEDFFEMLKDTKLVTYYNEIYNQNKERDWPSYIYNGKTQDIYSSVYSEKLFEDVKNEIKDEKTCEDKHLVTMYFSHKMYDYLLNKDNYVILSALKQVNLNDKDFAIIMKYAWKNNVVEILDYISEQDYAYVYSRSVCEYCVRYDDFETFKKYFDKVNPGSLRSFEYTIHLALKLNRKKYVEYIINNYTPEPSEKYFCDDTKELLEYKGSDTFFVKGYWNIENVPDVEYVNGLVFGGHTESVIKIYEEQGIVPDINMIPWGNKGIIEWAVKNKIYSYKDIGDILQSLINIQILQNVQACLENIPEYIRTEDYYFSFMEYCCAEGNLEIFNYLTLFLPLEKLSKKEKKKFSKIAVKSGNVDIAKKIQEKIQENNS